MDALGPTESNTSQWERELAAAEPPRYVLKLYITGMTPRSRQAIERIQQVCEQELKGRYDLEFIDIYKQPKTAVEEGIIATPTLIKQLPLPLRRLVGDMTDQVKLRCVLDLPRD